MPNQPKKEFWLICPVCTGKTRTRVQEERSWSTFPCSAQVQGRDQSDLPHPVVVVHDLVWSAKRDILSAQTEEELAKIEAEFDFAGRFLSGIGASANA